MRRTFWLTAGAVAGVWAYRKATTVVDEAKERGPSATAVAAVGGAIVGARKVSSVARQLAPDDGGGVAAAAARVAERVAAVSETVADTATRASTLIEPAARVMTPPTSSAKSSRTASSTGTTRTPAPQPAPRTTTKDTGR